MQVTLDWGWAMPIVGLDDFNEETKSVLYRWSDDGSPVYWMAIYGGTSPSALVSWSAQKRRFILDPNFLAWLEQNDPAHLLYQPCETVWLLGFGSEAAVVAFRLLHPSSVTEDPSEILFSHFIDEFHQNREMRRAVRPAR